jgi:thiamine-phosphate pyrophosphorylase
MVITHRHRLVEALQVPVTQALPCLVAQVEGALRGGADLVYLREPDLSVRDLMHVVAVTVERVPGAHRRLVVRDRIDVAATLGVGVHLPEQGLDVERAQHLAQRHGAPLVIGRSVHSPASAAASGGATYLVAGTINVTVSKPGLTHPLGPAGLRAVCDAAPDIPVFGVGGLGTHDIPDLRRAGAQGLAAIGLFIPSQICADVTEWTIERLRHVRNCIDSVEWPT